MPFTFQAGSHESLGCLCQNPRTRDCNSQLLPKSVGLSHICNSEVSETHRPNQNKLFPPQSLTLKGQNSCWCGWDGYRPMKQKYLQLHTRSAAQHHWPCGWPEVQTALAQEIAPSHTQGKPEYEKQLLHGERSYLIWNWTKLQFFFILWNVYKKVCLFQSYFLSSSRAVRNTSKGAGSRLAAEKSTGVFASHPSHQNAFPWAEEQVFLTRMSSPHQNYAQVFFNLSRLVSLRASLQHTEKSGYRVDCDRPRGGHPPTWVHMQCREREKNTAWPL